MNGCVWGRIFLVIGGGPEWQGRGVVNGAGAWLLGLSAGTRRSSEGVPGTTGSTMPSEPGSLAVNGCDTVAAAGEGGRGQSSMGLVEGSPPRAVDLTPEGDFSEKMACFMCWAKRATPSKLGWRPSAAKKRLAGRNSKPWSMKKVLSLRERQ